ncbi:MAG: glycoside hydrolase family 127 protein [Eubacteriales bacterium]
MKKLNAVDFHNTVLSGFWGERYKMVRETTIWAVYNRFAESGRFAAMKMDWKEGMPNRPHIFWDSDIAKWMESAAYLLKVQEIPELEKILEGLIDDIEEHQDKNGYYNIYFTVIEPEARFTRRTDHELYCAGHLFEAAVAYYEATGRERFLKLMEKYAQHIEKVFVTDKSAKFQTCGHEEIELALVKLYRCTGNKRYLELSRYFIDKRGTTKEDYYDFAMASYAQDHLPVRQQTTAEGHSVRATYLYCGMADMAAELEDKELLKACEAIFGDIIDKKMYITGGIGSSAHGECFTKPFDLPNLQAYAESCAAIGLAFFSHRMNLINPDGKYGDIIERVLYNGFLSSISLDGKSFFYENPLEIDPYLIGRDVSMRHSATRFPITQRLEVFGCSCCPPNITRFIASISNFLYATGQNTLYIDQYMDSATTLKLDGKDVSLKQRTGYPWNGDILVDYKGHPATLALRIPGWCTSYKLTADGKDVSYELKNGYAYIKAEGDTAIRLSLDMPVVFVEAQHGCARGLRQVRRNTRSRGILRRGCGQRRAAIRAEAGYNCSG